MFQYVIRHEVTWLFNFFLNIIFTNLENHSTWNCTHAVLAILIEVVKEWAEVFRESWNYGKIFSLVLLSGLQEPLPEVRGHMAAAYFCTLHLLVPLGASSICTRVFSCVFNRLHGLDQKLNGGCPAAILVLLLMMGDHYLHSCVLRRFVIVNLISSF